MFVYVNNLCLLISVIVIFTQAVELPRFRLKVPCQFLEKSSRRDLFKCERHPACLVSGKLNFRLSIGARGWIKRIDDTPLKFLQVLVLARFELGYQKRFPAGKFKDSLAKCGPR